MNFQADADDLDSVFAALAHRHRREIVDLLALQPASIQQLARQIGISLPAIHRHLAVLEQASLIQRKKSGRVNFLAIQRVGLRRVRDWALQYRTDWGSDEESLDNYIAAIRSGDQPPDPRPKE